MSSLFAPRIRNSLEQRLFTIGEADDYRPLNTLLRWEINTVLITKQRDEVLHLASSIQHGTMSASLLMRKLASGRAQAR